jgi:hypothetical protein
MFQAYALVETGRPDMGKFVRMLIFTVMALAVALAATASVALADAAGPGV